MHRSGETGCERLSGDGSADEMVTCTSSDTSFHQLSGMHSKPTELSDISSCVCVYGNSENIVPGRVPEYPIAGLRLQTVLHSPPAFARRAKEDKR